MTKRSPEQLATGLGADTTNESELTVTTEYDKEKNGHFNDFTTEEDPKPVQANRKTFRNSARLILRKPTPRKKEVTITSNGPFNGFDIKVKKTHYQDYKYLNFSLMRVIIELDGTFTGGKRMTTEMLNEIKNSTGFADKLKEIIIAELDERKSKVDETILAYDRHKLDDFTKKYNGAPVKTKYRPGKIAFDIYLTANYDVIIENIKKQVDCFVRGKKNNLIVLEYKDII